MNPELLRNLRIQLNPKRLVVMPVLIGLVLLAAALDQREDPLSFLYFCSGCLFGVICWFWGARCAGNAIVDELRDRTWDAQRMSAMTPWRMAWGKLAGSTAFQWYGGAFCLAVFVVSGVAGDKPFIVQAALILVAAAVLFQAASMLLNLQLASADVRLARRGGAAWLVFLLGGFAFWRLFEHHSEAVQWWSLHIHGMDFLLASALLFAAFALLGLWRVMAHALALRTLPWAWPLFALVLTVYVAGLAITAADHDFLMAFLIAAVVCCGGLTYLALFLDRNDFSTWQRCVARAGAGQWLAGIRLMPVWPTTLILTLIAGLMSALNSGESAGPLMALDETHWTLGAALMLTRDCAICLFFYFSRRHRNAVPLTLLTLIVIDGLLPYLAHVLGLGVLAWLILPIIGPQREFGLLVMVVQAALAIGLVAWRWRVMRDAVQ
jgi:hypothetical protein